MKSSLERSGDPVENLSISYGSMSLSSILSLCHDKTVYAMDNPHIYVYREGSILHYDRDRSAWSKVDSNHRVINELPVLLGKMSLPLKTGEILLMGYYNRRLRAYLRYGTFGRYWFPADVFRSYYIDASSPFPYCDTRKHYRYALWYSPWSISIYKVTKDL